MSDLQNNSKQLRLFLTAPHSCSYLKGMEASTLFVDPEASIDLDIYSYLSDRGFRRSGKFIYKPDCNQCSACISLRIPVADYQFSRGERRIMKRNADLSVVQTSHIFSDELYTLYADYICTRHYDGDMYPPSKEQYHGFLNDAFNTTNFFVFMLDGKPKAVAIVDKLTNALSAVYTFYDPFDEQRSLGTYAVLWQIQKARELGLSHVYLGYWVKNCQKMSYKTRFSPAEIYINKRWVPLISPSL